MKKEIVIDGKTYVLKDESKKECPIEDEVKFKVGDWIMVKDSELPIHPNWLGESGNVKHQGPFYVEIVSGGCVVRMSGIQVALAHSRFILATTEEIEFHLITEAKKRYSIGTKYRILDTDPAWHSSHSGDVVAADQEPCIMHIGESNELAVEIGKGFAYFRGEWAEIIKEEEIKIGDYKVEFEEGKVKIGCKTIRNHIVTSFKEIAETCKFNDFYLTVGADGHIHIRHNTDRDGNIHLDYNKIKDITDKLK